MSFVAQAVEMFPIGGLVGNYSGVVDNYILPHELVSIRTFLTEKKILLSEKFVNG